jgi:hypothetical protein
MRRQTGNGANFRLFRERDARGILPKKTEVVIPGAFSLVLSLDEQRKNKLSLQEERWPTGKRARRSKRNEHNILIALLSAK